MSDTKPFHAIEHSNTAAHELERAAELQSGALNRATYHVQRAQAEAMIGIVEELEAIRGIAEYAVGRLLSVKEGRKD